MPTSTPRPTPTQAPTPTPTPTQTPTPTPLPDFQTHTSEAEEYSVKTPYGWAHTATGRTDRFTYPAKSGNALEITAHDFQPDWSIAHFADSYRSLQLSQIPNWHHYKEISATGEFRDATNYVQIIFERRKTADACVEHAVSHLYRSRFFPVRLKGFSVTMTICKEDLGALGPKREIILESFAEQQRNKEET